MESPILNFFLLILRIPFNLSQDIGYKVGRFFKILLEKSLEFVSNKKDGTVTFNLGLILFLAEVDLISEKQGCNKNALKTHSIRCLEILFALSIEVITLFVGATII